VCAPKSIISSSKKSVPLNLKSGEELEPALIKYSTFSVYLIGIALTSFSFVARIKSLTPSRSISTI